MACDRSSEKDISVTFGKFSITSLYQTSSQTKNNSENLPPLQSQILSAIHKIRKSKIVLKLKHLRKKSIKPVAQVLVKARLRSIYLNY